MGKMYIGSKSVSGLINKSYSTTAPDPKDTNLTKTISTTSNFYRFIGYGTKAPVQATTLTSSSYYNEWTMSSTTQKSSTSSHYSRSTYSTYNKETATSSRYSRSTYSTYNKATATSSKYSRSTYSTSEKTTATGSSYSRTYITYDTYILSPYVSSAKNDTHATASAFPMTLYGATTTGSKTTPMTSATIARMTNQTVGVSYSVNNTSRTYTFSLTCGVAPRWTAYVTASAGTSTYSTSVSSAKTNKIIFTTGWNMASSASGPFMHTMQVSLRFFTNATSTSNATGNTHTGMSYKTGTGIAKAYNSSTYSGKCILSTSGSSSQYWMANTASYSAYSYYATGLAKQTIAQSKMTRTTSQKGTNSTIYTTSNALTYLYGSPNSNTYANTRASETYAEATVRDSKYINSATFESSKAYDTTANTTFGATKEFYRYKSTVTNYSTPTSVYVSSGTFNSSASYNTTSNTSSTSVSFSRYASTKTIFSAPTSVYVSSGTFNSSASYNSTSNTSSTSVSFSRYASTTTQLVYNTKSGTYGTSTATRANSSNASYTSNFTNKTTYSTGTY